MCVQINLGRFGPILLGRALASKSELFTGETPN